MLAAVMALDRAAPVRRDRFARLMDDHAIVGHGLRMVVGQVEITRVLGHHADEGRGHAAMTTNSSLCIMTGVLSRADC